MRSPSLPLAAIKVFEAVSRCENFTKAALELGMTQAAVSYQVRILEERTGGPLFYRKARGVELTPEGRLLAARASEALDILHTAFADVRRERDEVLSVASLATFAARVLAPRLGTFQIANPSVSTRVTIFDGDAETPAQSASVSIRFGSGTWVGCEAVKLMNLTLTPLISPEIQSRYGPFDTPEDLLRIPLIEPSHPNWKRWFNAAGVTYVPDLVVPRYERVRVQLLEAEAVLSGSGACLLTPGYFRDHLMRGELIQPFSPQLDIGVAIWLVIPSHRSRSPAVAAFRRWLTNEMKSIDA